MTTSIANAHCLANDGSFNALKQFLIDGTGLSYYCRRDGELAGHIARHLKRLSLEGCSDYYQLLKSGPAGDKELDSLIEDLTIGETFFFRHTDLFTALEQSILPELIERNAPQRRLRIWSAGSSIGAEAYTVSILLRRQFAHLIQGWDVTIIGTDINRSFLSRAASAQYEPWALRGISEGIKQQCFTSHDKAWTLRPEFKEGVCFQYHNLAAHPFPSAIHNLYAFDVILCRNVMIYFSQQVNETIVGKMRNCLVDGGWLLVGHAEHNSELFRQYRTVSFPGVTGYQRVGYQVASGARPPERPTVHAAPEAPAGVPTSPVAPTKAVQRPATDTPRQRPNSSSDLTDIRLLADRGELEHAEMRCQQMLKEHKLNPTYHLYHALVLEQLGKRVACEQSLRRALYLDRTCILAHYYLGLTLQRMGRHTEAGRSLQNARRLLSPLAPDLVVEDSDELTVAELDWLARIHLDALQS